jgi:hypothetical protein
MPYFTKDQPSVERVGKVTADIFVAAVVLVFAVVFFGPVGGILGAVVLEAALIGVDYLVPSTDDVPGNVVR